MIKVLERQIKALELHIPKHEIQNLKVSNSSIGWQIDHSLKVINGVIGMLKDAPTHKKPKVTFFGKVCLFLKFIPRGKGKAPKQVLPPENIKESALEDQLQQAISNLNVLIKVNDKVTFKHVYFGILSKKQTIRFLETHTQHHLKIIKDILR